MHNRVIEKPVAEVYRNIHIEKLDGEIRIQDAHFTKALYFIKGSLEFARTTVIQERLGEILYKMGKINQTQYWSLHKLMEGRRDRLGQILIRENMLDAPTLSQALSKHVTAIAVGALTLTSGTWEFSTTPPDIPDDSRLGITIPSVIAAGISRLGNLAYFRNRFYEQSCQRLPLDANVLASLDDSTRDLFNRLPELAGSACGLLAQRLQWTEDDTWTRLTHLYLINGITLKKVEKATADNDLKVEALLALFNRITTGKEDHYKILGIKDNADESEIKSAYFRLAKQYHPDRISNAPDPEIKEKANFVFAAINKAYDTLSDPLRRQGYDSGETDEDDPQSRARGNLKERARVLSQKAKTLYNQQRFWEAATLLDEAVRLDADKSAYFLLLGMAQVHIPSLRRAAERNLQKAVQLDPWNADAFAGLGILFQEENLVHRAEGFFRKALSINPDHKIARKRLGAMNGQKPKKRSFFGKKK